MATPTFWLITNRRVAKDRFSGNHDQLTYWTSHGGDLTKPSAWKEQKQDAFRLQLIAAADQFPLFEDPALHERQKHVTLAIHGFNVTWSEAVTWYTGLCKSMFGRPKSLGLCVLFTWPSDGMATHYLPDRMDAERSAADLADVLSVLYDWLAHKQVIAAASRKEVCRAKTSIIAHSMGNFVLQRAMQHAWTRKNQPLLISLINQLLMVAADVDNDLFGSGENVEKGDGDAIANLTYRITALYTGRDSVLGLSAGMKHFGKRRLGRSGLDTNCPRPDNVWDFECTSLFKAQQKDIHSAYFQESRTLQLMADVLRGFDRGVIETKFLKSNLQKNGT